MMKRCVKTFGLHILGYFNGSLLHPIQTARFVSAIGLPSVFLHMDIGMLNIASTVSSFPIWVLLSSLLR